MPFDRSGPLPLPLVRASRMAQSATSAMLVQTFWPLPRQPPSTFSARVCRLARSEPAPGSLNIWHQMSLPCTVGRNASAVEQLVIDEEFAAAGVKRRDLIVGGWAAPTLVAHGTPEQQERFVRPTVQGKLVWCQMFSEPGAGSDLASLQTRAEKVEGGWRVSGQK